MKEYFDNSIYQKRRYFNSLVLIVFVISVIISDWIIGPIAISEILFGLILLLIIFIDSKIIFRLNYKLISLISLYFVIHILLQISFNETFFIKTGMYNLVKILFYLFFIDSFYEYIKANNLKHRLLWALNIGTVIAIIIGIYITLAIATDYNLPHEFLWEYTRTDAFSYQYKGNSNIIRTRSLFSEPAHLGYYLNIVLSLNLFSKLRNRFGIIFQIIIIIGIITTLSYSTILIMLFLLFTKILIYLKNNNFKILSLNKNMFIAVLIIILIFLFLYREFLYTTIIERTIAILNGSDNSAYNRLINSWGYITKENLLLGNGLGHTPPIQNVYAYFLSDLGLFSLIAIILYTLHLLKINVGFGITFLFLNFSKGGYLSPIFTIFIIMILIFTERNMYRNILFMVK